MTWAPCPHGVRTRGKKSIQQLNNPQGVAIPPPLRAYRSKASIQSDMADSRGRVEGFSFKNTGVIHN